MTLPGGDGGYRGFTNARALAADRVDDARRRAKAIRSDGRWPGAGTIVRVVALVIVALLIVAWLLTVLSR